MTLEPEDPVKSERSSSARMFPFLMVASSMCALVATFAISVSDLEFETKGRAFAGIVGSFLALSLALHFKQAKRVRREDLPESEASIAIERNLNALEEAGHFFAGSLRSADTFRLVSNRVRDLLPFRRASLYLLTADRRSLRLAEIEGEGADEPRDRSAAAYGEELAWQSFTMRTVQSDAYLALDESQMFGSTAAIPLFNASEPFGVLQLYFDPDFAIDAVDPTLFEAVGSRTAPLILTSVALERTRANALTDFTTDLPNERAFYMMLENQIAESQRKRELRPLTILAIDIRNFDDINSKFGHASGDRVLNFAAQVIKDNLRQMDFLARALGDEFLAILPTASKEISHEVIARIHTGFFGRRLRISDDESVEIEINVGWAAFGADGETPSQLLSLAQLRKEQAKSAAFQNVVMFPVETAG